MRKVGRIVAGVVGVGLAASLGGCASGDAGKPEARREVPLHQSNSFEVVQLRSDELKPGMNRTDVYMLLGAPSEYRGDTWIYRGGVDGGKTLTIEFEDGKYADHTGG